mmetsp:Transcript_10931/g.21833  ORF Transcript_10931/g.21833 Transcript_10931/m.21833 type:complete len:135 (-) Transcript_10931:1616-2020(-)
MQTPEIEITNEDIDESGGSMSTIVSTLVQGQTGVTDRAVPSVIVEVMLRPGIEILSTDAIEIVGEAETQIQVIRDTMPHVIRNSSTTGSFAARFFFLCTESRDAGDSALDSIPGCIMEKPFEMKGVTPPRLTFL